MELNRIIPSAALRRLNPHLFGAARVEGRGSRAAVSREAELHEEIFDECRRRGWIALHGSMAERTCRTLGEPDFVILADGGRVLFVECKSRSGKLSPAQAALKHHAEKLGHTVQVVRSLEEFLELTTDHRPKHSTPNIQHSTFNAQHPRGDRGNEAENTGNET